jgi:uridylate kinase
MGKYAEAIKTLAAEGHQVAVVLGGGALARQFIGYAKELCLDKDAQDEVSMRTRSIFRAMSTSSAISVPN